MSCIKRKHESYGRLVQAFLILDVDIYDSIIFISFVILEQEFSRSNMEVQNRKPAAQLVFQHGKREQNQTFFTVATGSHHVRSRSIGQMRKKDVCLSSHGLVVVKRLA